MSTQREDASLGNSANLQHLIELLVHLCYHLESYTSQMENKDPENDVTSSNETFNRSEKAIPTKSEDGDASSREGTPCFQRSNSVNMRKMQKMFQNAAEENVRSIRAYVTELKERVAKLQYQKQLLVCQCQVSIIHRTQFYLLFKGDSADQIYMEVELRRLTWLQQHFAELGSASPSPHGDKAAMSLSSSMKALRREREFLAKRLITRLTAEERDTLYMKWDVPIDGKHRKLQFINKLWTDPRDFKHVQESAEIVAKLVGFCESGNVSKEMFELNFALPSDKRPWEDGTCAKLVGEAETLSRFIEWFGCCCGGAEKTQKDGEELVFPVIPNVPCRDMMFQHMRSKNCDLLDQLPSTIPLNSGIYGQSLISNQPVWLNVSDGLNSGASEENDGTRVLVPVAGGLIELFVLKQVPEDPHIVDFVMNQCNFSWEQEAMNTTNNGTPGFNVTINRPHDSVIPTTAFNSSAECGYNEGDAMNQNMVSTNANFHPSTASSLTKETGQENDSVKQENGRANSVSDCSDQDEDDDYKVGRGGKRHQSKNLVAERKRRKKLNDRLYTLRSLVPKITKVTPLPLPFY
ncbi:hypothetical protein GIB67_001342 [Kingdonia uniflora]|uniref:BHLH domain-containing protein n=1 Tax=Kingdonia uniflora TaxID=39325 RepID=A0A7J7MTM1_9MAGN|nr:hypothetical protein GIB67_001342 [Kingdonia uniflora]